MAKTKSPVITDAPLTSEAREVFLNNLFSEHLHHYSDMFVPDDNFYGTFAGKKQAKHMLSQLCKWLGIKPGYISLQFSITSESLPGGQHYTIYAGAPALNDEFVLGAVIAYGLTRYLLEARKQVRLGGADQAALLATASILFGLGLVVANGLSPTYGLTHLRNRKATASHNSILINYSETSYYFLLQGFIREQRIPAEVFQYSLTPWAAKRLHMNLPKYTSHIVRETRHKIQLNNLKLAGVAWVFLVVIGIGIFMLAVRIKPDSQKVIQAHEQVALLDDLSRDCKEALAYERQYADLTDIQTVRKLNADSLRCQSLDNQHDSAKQNYQQLLSSKN